MTVYTVCEQLADSFKGANMHPLAWLPIADASKLSGIPSTTLVALVREGWVLTRQENGQTVIRPQCINY